MVGVGREVERWSELERTGVEMGGGELCGVE